MARLNGNTTTTLTETQQRAVLALGAGKTVTEAATLAGVSRETIYQWRKIPAFAAAENLERLQARQEIRDSMRALGKTAVAAIRGLLESDATSDTVKAKLALDIVAWAKDDDSIGETDPHEIEVNNQHVAAMIALRDRAMGLDGS
jgi:hypothetical protein